MNDTYGKYIRLFGYIFFTFIGFILAFVAMLLCFRLFFGVLSFMPWTVYIYMLFIIAVPAAIFIPVYLIYFKRTKKHPSAVVKYISYAIFIIALGLWGYTFVADLLIFFKHYYQDISHYKSYELFFLAGNIGMIFFIGIIQALSTEKEVDWMEKYKEKQ